MSKSTVALGLGFAALAGAEVYDHRDLLKDPPPQMIQEIRPGRVSEPLRSWAGDVLFQKATDAGAKARLRCSLETPYMPEGAYCDDSGTAGFYLDRRTKEAIEEETEGLGVPMDRAEFYLLNGMIYFDSME